MGRMLSLLTEVMPAMINRVIRVDKHLLTFVTSNSLISLTLKMRIINLLIQNRFLCRAAGRRMQLTTFTLTELPVSMDRLP